ncbi:protein kinase domain-containing protein [Clavibacter nebraskensis]|uniref:protein kinase domain-containing protein n=1 Tax=Clavibacter nebraskensis TaxID=31963 RepID=UPI00215D63ED|nr:protein kinase [Clavibacter nebraskensis]
MSASGTVVAGYRLVRLVGRGSRCEVHLGRPCRASDQGSGPAANVAVKIVPATERSRGEAEIVALQAVSSDHVVALRDVATLADGSLCIVQSLGQRGTASALLSRRGSITPGETVTLVASVLRGLGDLHDAGIAHGSVDLTHVVLDAIGRPLLSGLGSSRVIAGGAGADGRQGADPVEEDLGRVSRIVRALRDPADARGRASEDRWEGWLAVLDATIHGETDLTAHDLADRLLDVADAAPLADAGPSSRSSDDHRILPPGATLEAVGPGPSGAASGGQATPDAGVGHPRAGAAAVIVGIVRRVTGARTGRDPGGGRCGRVSRVSWRRCAPASGCSEPPRSCSCSRAPSRYPLSRAPLAARRQG